jgi:hypothetical protein
MGFSNVTFMSPGKRFQKHRKLLQEYFSRQKVLEYMSFQTGQARVLAIEFAKLKAHESREHVLERSMPSLADICSWITNLIRFSTNGIARIVYGYDMFLDADDTLDRLARDHSYIFTHCGPMGGTPVDLFPIRALSNQFVKSHLYLIAVTLSPSFSFVVSWNILCQPG